MIDLNLIPENLKKKRRTQNSSHDPFYLPVEKIVGLIVGVVFILIVIHIFLVSLNFRKISQKRKLDRQWQEILPQKNEADQIVTQLRSLQTKIASIEKITIGHRILIAPKLNVISDSVPRGIWLDRIALQENILTVEGRTVSKMADETTNVSSFFGNLKKQKDFMDHVIGVDPGPIQRKNMDNVEVAAFSMTAKLE